MQKKLPPLNALRAFEAGARHLSFTRAAEELHVTQTAVSHQVRQLEEELGFPLFRRSTRRLELTAEGQRLAPPLSQALDRIGEEKVREAFYEDAARWFLPDAAAAASAPSRCKARTSLIIPAPTAADSRITLAVLVSTETIAPSSRTSLSTTGTTRSSSSCSDTGSAPGRVDSPPTSIT